LKHGRWPAITDNLQLRIENLFLQLKTHRA
jgi:hypothetical protein